MTTPLPPSTKQSETTVTLSSSPKSGDDFTKTPVEQFQDALVALPEMTPRQRIFKVFLWTVITLSTTLAVPCGTLAYSYGQEKAKRETEERQKKTEARTAQRKLQLDLLKEIIIVAKTAEFKDPKSIYRLGLISHMVNENNSVFGIQLAEAEQTMKQMFDRLAPLAGLRRRLSESQILLADITNKYKTAKKGELDTKSEITELNKTLSSKSSSTLSDWKKKRLKKNIREKIAQLQQYRTERQFYEERLVHENKVKVYFTAQLAKQEKSLQTALQETTKLRDSIKRRTKEFKSLVKRLQANSPQEVKDTMQKIQVALKAIESDHSKAEQTIKRLNSELTSERNTLDSTKRILSSCAKKLKACRAELKEECEEVFIDPEAKKKKVLQNKKRTSASSRKTSKRKTVTVSNKSSDNSAEEKDSAMSAAPFTATKRTRSLLQSSRKRRTIRERRRKNNTTRSRRRSQFRRKRTPLTSKNPSSSTVDKLYERGRTVVK